MWHLALILLVSVQLEGKVLNEIAERRGTKILRSPHERQCDVRLLSADEARLKCESRDGRYVPNGRICTIIPITLDRTLGARCELGVWVSIDGRGGRFKRGFNLENAGGGATLGAKVGGYFGPIGKGIGAVFGALFCGFFCSSKEPEIKYVVKKAPTYGSTCPPSDLQPEYFTPEGVREVAVSWTPPSATDEDGSIASDKQTSKPLNGEPFKASVHGLRHTVAYEAKDNDGMSVYCMFTFTVTVRTCKEIPRISKGYKECNAGNIYGSECVFHCDEGYERSGDATAKCQQDGSWSGTAACSKKRCAKPSEVTNGVVTCLNPDYEYQSICFVSCNKGFDLEGAVVMQCNADQTWDMAGLLPQCIDVEPPTILCLTPQIFYADRGLLTASSVVWEEPTAYDTVDNNPVIVQTKGVDQGSTLSEGSTYVSYSATDANGNKSPECSIELRVELITCRHPADTFTDTKLIFNCSDSMYNYGVTCSLSCDLNLPLDGAETVECKADPSVDDPVGQWDWGSGEKPVCRVISCPPLDGPINGLFLQDSVDTRPEVRMMCNDQWDIPEWDAFDGTLQCYDSLNWGPLDKLPDCIRTHSKRIMNLASELYYYTGECQDPDTQEQIRQQFLTIITEATESRFHSICSADLLNCSLDSVTITCGPISRKKRDTGSDTRRNIESYYPERSKREISNTFHHINKREETHALIITFNIVTEFDVNDIPGNLTYGDQLEYIDKFQLDQKAVIAELLADGTLNIENCTLREDSFQTSEYGADSCAYGMIKKRSKCKPCPKGRFFDGGETCTECPIGKYRDTDTALACIDCPEGMTTEKTGSVSLDNCTKICSPGSFSKKGLAPCSLCPVGTYQNSDGMTSCDPCQSGQTTATQGSTSQAACQGFDVLLRSTTDDLVIGTLPAIDSLSIMFWAKLFSVGSMSMTSLRVTDDSDTVIMSINIAPEISVQVGDTLVEAGAILSDTKWDHVAVVWNSVTSSLQVFIDGELKNGQTVSLPTLTDKSIAVHSTASEGVYLTGLLVVDKVLKEEDIQPHLTSCTETMDDSLLSMDSFLGKSSNALKIITPAICDAIDECATSPCGDHLCVNEIGNFSCICSQGMTGRLCDIPRDYCIGNECKHGATCNNQDNGYTCTCVEGFSGSMCEIVPVNGAWSEYGEWSSCSVSCEQGTRTRDRTCNNPPPGVGGQSCSGSETESEECNLGECKECSAAPPRCFGIFPNCSTDPATGIKQCFPYCRNGTFMQPSENKYENYTCGPDTNYEWQPFNWCPECVDEGHVGRPNSYRLETSVDYESPVPSSSTADVTSKVKDAVSANTDCVTKELCTVAVSIDDSGSRRKRNTGSVLRITFEVVLGDNGKLKINDYVGSGAVSDGLQDLVESIVSMELTAADLQANASSYFNVDSGGVTYTIDGTSLTLDGIVDCPSGSVSDDGLCVECPVGTKVDSNSCLYCDVGSFQDETGQTGCKQCPTGFSTSTIGARDVSECTESVTVTSSSATIFTGSTDSTTRSDDSEEEDDDHEDKPTLNKTGIIAGIAIGSFAVVLAAIAIIMVCYYKHARKTLRQTQRGSFASLDMVGPTNSRPASNTRFMRATSLTVRTEDTLPPVFNIKAGAGALMKEKDFQEIDDLTQYPSVPPSTTCFSPPPPYTENP